MSKTNKFTILNGLHKTKEQAVKQARRWQRRNSNRIEARIQITKNTAILLEKNGGIAQYYSNYKF